MEKKIVFLIIQKRKNEMKFADKIKQGGKSEEKRRNENKERK